MHETFAYSDDGELQDAGRNAIQQALSLMTISFDMGHTAVGNPKGISFIDKYNTTLYEVAALKAQVATLIAKDEAKEARLATLEKKMKTVEAASERLFGLRERFFEMYKRGQDLESADYKNIQTGNRVAHAGDCGVDALLYILKRRTDVSVFREIYYLSPWDVNQLSELNDTLAMYVVNQRATLVADPLRCLHPRVEAAFLAFIKVLENEAGKAVDIEDQSSALTQSYLVFCKVYREEDRNGNLAA
ncbi:hypothetical protein MMC30_007429 [Trapelia coarctata]|nr:hypothetical protein [Trapelia coarctata]